MTTMTRDELPHMGDRLEALLREQGIRQAELARRLRWSRQQVSALFARKEWRARTVGLIARALGVSETVFYRDQDTLPSRVKTD